MNNNMACVSNTPYYSVISARPIEYSFDDGHISNKSGINKQVGLRTALLGVCLVGVCAFSSFANLSPTTSLVCNEKKLQAYDVTGIKDAAVFFDNEGEVVTLMSNNKVNTLDIFGIDADEKNIFNYLLRCDFSSLPIIPKSVLGHNNAIGNVRKGMPEEFDFENEGY